MTQIKSTKEELMNLLKKQGIGTVDDDTYTECANFLFLTSWFEELLFNDQKRQCPKNDAKICADLSSKIDLTCFDFFDEHFSARYFNKDETTTHFFNNLRSKEPEKIRTPLLSFLKNKDRTQNLLYAYLMITYRFRNNMFHGSKGLINISKYLDEFKVINHFMCLLLTEVYKINYKGYNE